MNHIRRRHAVRTTLLAFATAAVLAAPLASAADADTELLEPTDYDQFIVKFRDGSAELGNATARKRALDGIAHRQGVRIDPLRRMAVGADVIRTDRRLDARQVAALVAELQADPRVEYATPDLRVVHALTPNDPYFSSQWGMATSVPGINGPWAWDISTGAGQVIAVVDTGITPHGDLDANVVAGYDFITNITTALDGNGRDPDPTDPGDWYADGECGKVIGSDSSWHGTHVAGIAAAVGNNAAGVVGVAYGAKIQPVRVLGKCGGVVSDISDAIVWASGGAVSGIPANPTPADVINLSLGGSGACPASTQAAINTAVANGTIVVVAAGNNGADASGYNPANCGNVITVAASGSTGARASYSNYGSLIDITAPGSSIYSTYNYGTHGSGQAGYGSMSGTSMAAPHVAGTVALMRAATTAVFTTSQVEQRLKIYAQPMAVACPEGCGGGLLDAFQAISTLTDTHVSIDDPQVAEGQSGTRTLTFTVSLDRNVYVPASLEVSTVANSGTATSGVDYTAATQTLVFDPGTRQKTFAVTIHGDTDPEPDETFTAYITNDTENLVVVDRQGTGTIVNDDEIALQNGVPVGNLSTVYDAPSRFYFDVPPEAGKAEFVLSGGTGNGDLVVKLGAPPTNVDYDCDAALPGAEETCTFEPVTSGRYYVMVQPLYQFSGGTLTATWSLPTSPQLSVGDATVIEGNGGTKLMTFTVSLSKASAKTVVFDLATANGSATAGSDYVAKAVPGLTIPIGQLSRTFNVVINGDSVLEPDETYVVDLTNATNSTVTDAQGTGTITNDDGPTLSIADAGFQEGNSGTKILTFTVTLSQPSIYPVTYNIATANGTAVAGSDYTAKSLVAETLPAGQTSRTFSVTTEGDTQVEGNETLYVQLGNTSVPVTDIQARGMLVNDDGPVLSISDASVTEGNSGTRLLTFTVGLSQLASAKVTFNFAASAGTAVAGSDFDPVSVTGLTIPFGQLSRTVSVVVRGDTNVEANETLHGSISMANVSILDGVGIGTITNDD
jgi:serine protease